MDTYTHLAQLRITITPTLEHIYAALNILSILLLSILTVTIVLSKRLKRDPTLLNTFVVIILVGFTNILYYLVRGGHPLDDDDGVGGGGELPAEGVCRAQACLLAGSQAAQAAAVFSMCFQLWINLMQLDMEWVYKVNNRYTTIVLLVLPYLCIIAFVPPMVIATGETPELLTPSPFYCSLENGALRSIYSKIALVFSALSLLIELHLIYITLRRFRLTSQITPHSTRPISLIFILRVGVFILWTVCMMMATLYQAFDETTESPVSDMIFACIGLLAFICFASQPDILRVWGVRKLARWWTRRKEVQEDGWSDFLGRDESDTTLSTRLEPVAQVDIDEVVERKSPRSSPSPGEEEEQGEDGLDLMTILHRGPSRERW